MPAFTPVSRPATAILGALGLALAAAIAVALLWHGGKPARTATQLKPDILGAAGLDELPGRPDDITSQALEPLAADDARHLFGLDGMAEQAEGARRAWSQGFVAEAVDAFRPRPGVVDIALERVDALELRGIGGRKQPKPGNKVFRGDRLALVGRHAPQTRRLVEARAGEQRAELHAVRAVAGTRDELRA